MQKAEYVTSIHGMNLQRNFLKYGGIRIEGKREVG